jgi:hypothetical protein
VRSVGSPEDFADPSSFSDLDYENPRAMAEWARRMGDAAGVDMGEDYEQMLDEIEHGGEDLEGMAGGDLGDGGMDSWDE